MEKGNRSINTVVSAGSIGSFLKVRCGKKYAGELPQLEGSHFELPKQLYSRCVLPKDISTESLLLDFPTVHIEGRSRSSFG